ncbi:hypothetical protein ASPZODRAFT_135188 [Penicilliopsis zonata CBS 506.65]|uniref:UBR-type domain-containing protein n=1 Tax=Penicilliopsis zonata CBS 506.65 TaxID=1073090 RepID=A0A1L9SB58_9EURO|nr:hypothetical protein ASPZODRAFT_135188 [Penicilliopsis zonata CBS 506.65]OJJ44376.1 hypothetical protein ASPZODRAFT_135188 [Penicilliopsis zonata CBS 506.65]
MASMKPTESVEAAEHQNDAQTSGRRRESFTSQNSHTAREFIDSQLQLEADAREVLPYSFDSCTQPLGPLRQSLFACITCNPPPSSPDLPYTSAAVCYSCSISCHGEHTLVELFSKRDFVCDCGTTRMPPSAPCNLRNDPKTGARGVHSEEPAPGNKYNHNFQNRFCGCGEEYDAQNEKGTMFQCLGLGTAGAGGCGEDWWHPECLIGLRRDWNKETEDKKSSEQNEADQTPEKKEENVEEDEETPLPPGFPGEDDFDTFICYKCMDSNPWLKRYAGTPGFLPPVYKDGGLVTESKVADAVPAAASQEPLSNSKKRRNDEDGEDEQPAAKRNKEEPAESPVQIKEEQKETTKATTNPTEPQKKHDSLPATAPMGSFSLFLKEDFRDHLCRCAQCFPHLANHRQLREEEETYEPPLSDDEEEANGGGSTGTGSLLDRGEAALSNVDRVRAIEGAMVYNHLRDKVKEFLKPFAESGQAVSAEDIKSYFEKLRGDEQGIKDAGDASALANRNGGDDSHGGSDDRKEQSGY